MELLDTEVAVELVQFAYFKKVSIANISLVTIIFGFSRYEFLDMSFYFLI